jgi:hypothetical protein
MAKSKFSPHVLVFLDGQALTGTAQDKTFTIKSEDGVFKVPASRISTITFEKGSPSGLDEMLLKSTSRIRGSLLPDPIRFLVADTGAVAKFPHRRLHSLVMFLDA